jgi:allantoinase
LFFRLKSSILKSLLLNDFPSMALLALQSSRIVTNNGIHSGAVLIADGEIRSVVSAQDIPPDAAHENFGNLVIMAGLVDTHVHINEPGRTDWEGFETATRAAAAGGITTLVDMPLNCSPVTTTVDSLKKKIEAAQSKLWVDCGFYAGLIPGNANHLMGLVEAGVLGVKAFLIHSGIDEFPNAGESDLRAGMPTITSAGVPLLVHCELPTSSSISSFHHSNPRSYAEYLSSRPRQWEQDAIELMIRLCNEYRCKTHIVHLSSADAVPALRDARESGLPLTVESCPHYLYFCAEEIPDGDTLFKCAPPIREHDNKERLWEALNEKVIDFIVSDHSPCPPAMKLPGEGDFMKAWGGIASLQFGLSIVWTEARKRGFTVSDLAAWMCSKPAELVGLADRKGTIGPGFDADIVVWNPEAQFTIQPSMIRHRHKATPYAGKTFYGTIMKTYLHGSPVFDQESSVGVPNGRVVLRGN